ncbi:MAG: hypothetical protein PHU40_09400 [Sulfurimonas sp.]|nr:hypothetical protein [Sulfurimonas sp.]
MDTSYKLDSYRSHDLNIMMKTSSGDIIKMDFANANSASLSYKGNENSSEASMSFSSMQSFKFSVDGNGLDAQDQKEIKEFMKVAQPFIDDFIAELQQDAPQTPVTKIAQQIASIFEPEKSRDESTTNAVKNNIVKLFDNSMAKLEPSEIMDKIFKESQNLLEQTLKAFENFDKEMYA